MSPEGRVFLANRIEAVCGFDTSVQGASWSPWNGITVWITISDARLQILSVAATRPLFEIRNIAGKIPMGGKSEGSKLRLGSVKSLGNTLSKAATIPLHWKENILRTDIIATDFSEITCDIQASMRLTRGLPFQIYALTKEQSEKKIEISESVDVTLGTVAGQGRFQGYLIAPGTWQGQCFAEALDIVGSFQGQENHFERGQMVVIFKDAILRCLDARLIGETMSILGNATMLKDGRAAAIARIVSEPDTLMEFSKHTRTDQKYLI